MDDLERYGDYNEVDEPPKKSYGLLVIKILATVICAAVIGVLIFRIVLFNHSPRLMSTLYFTDNLTEYYNENDGEIGALTQRLRSPYDDAELGNFFCDDLIVIPGCGELQVSVRYNESVAETFRNEYGLENFDTENKEQFSFRLWRDGSGPEDPGYEIGRLTVSEWESYSMYRYCKLVFDGIDFYGDDPIEWIRLEITVDGADKDAPFMIPVYENHSGYSSFDEYVLGREEHP